MESLSEMQIATTLTEETLKELMESNGVDVANAEALGSPVGNNSCEDSDCKNTLDFCCKVTIEKGFNVSIANTSLQFNTSLFCFVDPCPCNVTVSPGRDCPTFCIALYPTRIIGCIQWRASTGNVTGERFVGSPNGFVCCDGSICVNQIVDYQQCPPTREEAFPKPVRDEDIDATITATREKCELLTVLGQTNVVKFTGTFTLPTECASAAICQPPCTPPVCPTVCPPCPTVCPPCPTVGPPCNGI